MADTKISGLAALTNTNVTDDDLLVIVDVTDTSMGATGTNKKLTVAELHISLQKRDLGVDHWGVVGGFFL